ncbi:MAG: hypothetical protein VCF24_01550 [Candidatus Latescibacterota bacterium]
MGPAPYHFRSGRFDVAFIDLGLAGVPGDILVRELSNDDPALATVLITGWMLDERDPQRQPFDFYLQKPLLPDAVERILPQAMRLHDSRIAP